MNYVFSEDGSTTAYTIENNFRSRHLNNDSIFDMDDLSDTSQYNVVTQNKFNNSAPLKKSSKL